MRLLNSSGLLVEINEAVPTVLGNWNAPYWTNGASVGYPNVSVLLRNAQFIQSGGVGWFDLENKISGTRGTISLSFVAGPQGFTRGLAVLTSSTALISPRILLNLDGLNRPMLEVQNVLGVVVATTMASYTPISEGTSVTVILSWDSTQAIDGTRFAKFLVQSGSIPSGDWLTDPVAIWSPFVPTAAGLGFGTSLSLPFNGQIVSFQVSNEVYAGSGGPVLSLLSTHVLDCFASDTISMTEDDRTNPPEYTFDATVVNSIAVSDSVGTSLVYAKSLADTAAILDTVSGTKQMDRSGSDAAVVSDAAVSVMDYGRFLSDAAVVSDATTSVMSYERILADAAAILDTTIGLRTKVIDSSASDAAVTSDAADTFMTYGRTPSDAAVTSDAVSSVSLVYSRIIADSVGSSDSSSSLVTR